MRRSDERTLLELMLGNIIFGVLGVIILLIFPGRLYNELGFIEGILISCAMTLHMYYSLVRSLEMNEGGALKNTRLTYAVRVAGVLVAFAFIAWLDIGNVITGVIGLFALKVAAYIQPFTHKILERKFTGKGR